MLIWYLDSVSWTYEQIRHSDILSEWNSFICRGPNVYVRYAQLHSHVRLFVIPWTVAYQAPQSMGFSRQEYWSGLPFPSSEALPDPGVGPESPALHVDSLLLSPCGCVLNALVRPLSLWLHPLMVSLLLDIPDYSFFSFSSKYFLLSFNLEDSVHIVSPFWNVLCPLYSPSQPLLV